MWICNTTSLLNVIATLHRRRVIWSVILLWRNASWKTIVSDHIRFSPWKERFKLVLERDCREQLQRISEAEKELDENLESMEIDQTRPSGTLQGIIRDRLYMGNDYIASLEYVWKCL